MSENWPNVTRRQVLGFIGAGSLVAAAGSTLAACSTDQDDKNSDAEPSGAQLRIDHVTVVDPSDGSTQEDMSVVVAGGKISAVAAGLTTGAAKVVDGNGQYLVPGYNNMHVHPLQAQRPALFMASMLAEGVTGFRQMGATTQLLAARATGQLQLPATAPELLTLGSELLTPQNAPTVEAVRSLVQQQKAAGADFIKIITMDREVFLAALDEAKAQGLMTTGHVPMTMGFAEAVEAGYGCVEHMGATPGVFVDAAGKGFRLPGGDTQRTLPDLTSLDPNYLINPEAFDSATVAALQAQAVANFDRGRARKVAQTMADAQSWQCPTLVRLRTQELMDDASYQDDPWLNRMTEEARADYEGVLKMFLKLPADRRRAYQHSYQARLEMIGLWQAAGVRMMTGSDGTGSTPGLTLQLEFGELAKAGLTPLEILQMTTVAPADFLGRSATMGQIAPGMNADLVLLEKNPLSDVENLGAITAVVRAGQHHTSQELATLIEQLDAEETVAEHTSFNGRRDCCSGHFSVV